MMNTEHIGQPGGLQRSFRVQDFATPGMISRERSFVRPQSHHHPFNNHHQLRDGGKRKSMIVTTNNRGKPTMEIYRPPSVRVDGVQQNKLNVHAKEFTMMRQNDLQNSRSQMNVSQMGMIPLHHSKSSGNILHQLGAQQQQQAAAAAAAALARPALPPLYHHQAIPLISSQSSGNILHSAPRVHFKLPQQLSPMTPQNQQLIHQEKKRSPPGNAFSPRHAVQRAPFVSTNNQLHPPLPQTYALKRSKSLTSADTLASGMAALGLTADAADLGAFPQEIQDNLEKASQDPNQLSARILMELVGHVMRRAVESPRYALPAARQCIAIIERERTETFLESLLNTCQQWYRDRDKLLNVMMGGGRPRLMAFISLLLELFCQLRRRCSNQSGQPQTPASGSAITPPARTLLTLICKCCEECIRAPVPSASDTENLFFVLTYIGRDLETHLPGDLENLLAAVRDAFLNASAGPSITKTLLQLIELHASHWQLPGGAVLYYYPSSK